LLDFFEVHRTNLGEAAVSKWLRGYLVISPQLQLAPHENHLTYRR